MTAAHGHAIPYSEAVRVWARVAALSFGGPAGQIAVMHRILVEEKRWIGEQRFLHALNYCMLLPGPEAQQLAIYIGWLLHKTKGGLIAGLLFVLPGFVAILGLSYLYVLLGDLKWIEGLFFGLKAAVLAVVLQAVVRVGSRALTSGLAIAIAVAAFLAISIFAVPFPAVVVAAGLVGYLGGIASTRSTPGTATHISPIVPDTDTVLGDRLPGHARPNSRWALKISSILLLLWLAPVALLLALLGPDHVFSRIATFFSQMAVVTFGGAYAVLAYVAQEAVETYRWLAPGEMLDGLAMAETTPGPLIMVTQFVGFMGAYRNPGVLDPLLAATFGAVLTTWVTFVPCFLWIFLGAPFIEKLRDNRSLSAALSGITAAVVGVILSLALWFALHTLFGRVDERQWWFASLDVPVWSSVNLAALMLTIGATVAIFRFRTGTLTVLAICAAVGIALRAGGVA